MSRFVDQTTQIPERPKIPKRFPEQTISEDLMQTIRNPVSSLQAVVSVAAQTDSVHALAQHSDFCFCDYRIQNRYEHLSDYHMHRDTRYARRIKNFNHRFYPDDVVPARFVWEGINGNRWCRVEFRDVARCQYAPSFPNIGCQLCHLLEQADNFENWNYPSNFGYPTWYYVQLPSFLFTQIQELGNQTYYLPELIRLLLIAGDVESNPGPCYSKCTAQIGVTVDVKQLNDLLDIVNKLSDTFASLVKPAVFDSMKARITSLILSLWNLIRWSTGHIQTCDLIVNLVGSLVTVFPLTKLRDTFNYIFKGVSAQSAVNFSVPAAVKALFVIVFLVVSATLPGKHTIDEFVVRVRNIPQALKSLGSFVDMIDPLVKECIAFVEEKILGLDVSASCARTIEEVTQFADKVAEYTELHKRRAINKDPALAKEAGRLHYDAVRLLGRCCNMNYDRKSIEFLRSLLPTTYKISESALSSGADMNKIRRKPIVIWLAGQSQIGKTTLIMKLIQDIDKHSSVYYKEHGELPEDWQKEIFTCCPENEYMDGYHGQNWVTLDEFNQMRDSIANPSAENFILLRAISQFPYLLHMAALHEKPNSYMSSHGFVLTSNSTNIQPESIKTKEAITNRIGCPYKMEVKPEYRILYDNNRKYKLDVQKVLREFGGYTTDVYYFVEFDPLTERELPGYYTYSQFLWRLCDAYDRETTNFNAYGDYLDSNRKAPLPSRDDPTNYTPPPSDFDSSSSDESVRRPPRVHVRRGPLAQVGDLEEQFLQTIKNNRKMFPSSRVLHKNLSYDERDYSRVSYFTFPFALLRNVIGAPFLVHEELCERSSLMTKYVPTITRRVNQWMIKTCWQSPRTYVRMFDYSALQTIPLREQVTAFAQSSFFLSDSECDSVSRHITSFKTMAINRLQCLKDTAVFYLPSFMTTVVSALAFAGIFATKLWFLKRHPLWQLQTDCEFRDKLSEAEKCYLNGCDCSDCKSVDYDKYESDFIFWNVPCKCYVDFCNAQSITDQQKFMRVISQSTNPTSIVHPRARVQMASFAQRCKCDACPLCEGEVCLCKGMARSRGVEIGEDDLLDRTGLYENLKSRLVPRFVQSPPTNPIRAKEIVRTQSNPRAEPIVKTIVRTQSPQTSPHQTRILIKTQSIDHEHVCKSCRRVYSHSHPLGVNGVDHRQYDLQCPYEDCVDFHKGHHDSRKLQFAVVSCNHGKECTCPDQYNEAVEEVLKEYPQIARKDTPEFVRYDDASKEAQNLWDEFAGLTYVQGKKKLAELMDRLQLRPQASYANDVQAHDFMHNRLWPNILRMYIVDRDDESGKIVKQLGHIVALGGDLFLTCKHFIAAMKMFTRHDVVIRHGNIVWKRLTPEEFSKDVFPLGTKDAVVIRLVYKGNAFAKITQHFLRKSMSLSHECQSVVLNRYSMKRTGEMYPNPLSSSATLQTSQINIDLQLDTRTREIIVQPISWEYSGPTFSGDCAAPLVLLNSRIPTKICGIHNSYADALNAAYAVPVYFEDIEKALDHFGVNSQYGWSDLLPVEDASLLALDDGDNFRVVSVVKGALPQPVKTKLRPSPIFGTLTQTKTKPGYLRPFSYEGKEINPVLLARKKWGYHLPTLDKTKVEMCDNALSQLLCQESNRDCEEYRMPLTLEQSIVGVNGVEFLASMNKQSSPGYPYIFSKPPGKGKTGYFGSYEWDLSSSEARIILDAIENMEREMLNGNRPFVVSVDTMKDARIPIEKANAGKTRIFSAEPVDYCALHRKYFLPFTAHVMANRLKNGSAPGINATSPEFNLLATLLRSKGDKVIAADYSQFDGKIPTEAILSYYKAACEWYRLNWDLICSRQRNIVAGRVLTFEEFRTFLMRIALECVNHVHVCEKQNESGERFLVFYVVMNGQPSGNPGTACSNTGAGIWIVMYCFLTDVTPVRNIYLDKFFDLVYICCYGDDMIMNVSDSIIEIFNQNSLTDSMMRNFLLECTDEQKSGEIPPPYRNLNEVTFLKRNFVWNSDIHMYVGALPVDLLFDITNWCRTGGQDPLVITVDNLHAISREIALHGETVFSREIPKIRNAYRSICRQAGKYVIFDTYLACMFKYRDGSIEHSLIV